MHSKKAKIFVAVAATTVLFITGCWDKVEIDKRAFVALIGVDKFEAVSKDKIPKISKEDVANIQKNRYTTTYVYPNTGVIALKQEGNPKFSYTSVGEDLFATRNSLDTRIARRLSMSHTKAVVMGEAVAKDERLLRELLDRLGRSSEISRKVNILVTPETAKDVLNTNTKDEAVLGLFIRDLINQKAKSSRIADADFGYIMRSLHESKTAIIPRITSSPNEFKIAGAGVIKDFRLVGWLGEMETSDLMFMMDKVKNSVIDVEMEKLIIPLQITSSKTKKKVFEKDGNIIVSLKIRAEADIKQHLFQKIGETAENSYYKRLQKKASEDLEKQIVTTYQKIQKEFGADLLQAGEYLRKHEPDLWDKVKNDWDAIFPTTKMEVHVDLKIRRPGAVI